MDWPARCGSQEVPMARPWASCSAMIAGLPDRGTARPCLQNAHDDAPCRPPVPDCRAASRPASDYRATTRGLAAYLTAHGLPRRARSAAVGRADRRRGGHRLPLEPLGEPAAAHLHRRRTRSARRRRAHARNLGRRELRQGCARRTGQDCLDHARRQACDPRPATDLRAFVSHQGGVCGESRCTASRHRRQTGRSLCLSRS